MRWSPKRLSRRLTAVGAAGALMAVHLLDDGVPVVAYEWQSGPGHTCNQGNVVVIQAYVYGDWNLYSNYGLENYGYNIPETQRDYVFASTSHQSISSSAAEAGDHGGYVDGPVGVDCGPK